MLLRGRICWYHASDYKNQEQYLYDDSVKTSVAGKTILVGGTW
jgi:hypothetical protein